MRTIKVGELFTPGVTRFEEMPEYNYRSGQHQLLVPLKHIRPKELRDFRSGSARFAYCFINEVIIFQYRFGTSLPWSDCAYTWHKVPTKEQQLPPQLEPKERAVITCVLLEATTGIVAAMRLLSFSPSFSNRLHNTIVYQAGRPLPADYDQRAAAVFASFSSGQLRTKAVATCIGATEKESPY